MTSASSRKTPRRIWWSYDTVPVRNFKHGILSTPSGRILVTATEYTTTSILYSDNVGLTWTAATTPDTLAPTGMLLVPHTNTLGYRLVAVAETAAGSSPALYSDDNGSTWTAASLSGIRGLRSLCRHGVTGYLFAAGYSGTDTTDTATTEVLRSTDNGATWTSVYTNAGGGVGSKIVYDPLRNSLCVVTENGAAHSIVSFDAGDTWTAHTGSARRAWRDMIWDRARGCLVKVCADEVRTANVLGETYKSVIMPDGREWFAENLRYVNGGVGTWWQNGSSDDGYGAYYGLQSRTTEISTINTLLTDNWRVPTVADSQSFHSAIAAVCGSASFGNKLNSVGSTYWASPSAGENVFNFDARGSGRFYYSTWEHKKTYMILALDAADTHWFTSTKDNGSGSSGAVETGYPAGYRAGIRLVRDTPSAYASTDNMYRSFDGGVTWEVVPGSRPAFGLTADMSGRLFTLGDSSVRRSDNGLDWRDADSEAGTTWRRAFFAAGLDKIIACGPRGLSRFLVTGNT